MSRGGAKHTDDQIVRHDHPNIDHQASCDRTGFDYVLRLACMHITQHLELGAESRGRREREKARAREREDHAEYVRYDVHFHFSFIPLDSINEQRFDALNGWMDNEWIIDLASWPDLCIAASHCIALHCTALHSGKGVTLREDAIRFLARWFLPRFLSRLLLPACLPN